jgi:hypothetical protein
VDKDVQRSRGSRDRRRTSGRPSRRLLERWADERLIELVLAGDEPAFEELFERHAADALWFARDVLGSWEEAEEAVRHSFAAAHAYLASRDPDVEFAPWLRTILTNHCLSMLQARAPEPRESRGAPVVDLAAWRRKRRRLLGGAIPLTPSAGLHDGVLAAFGIGSAGAGAAAAPLLGGTLAKVAVVAVLATSVGVAGDVATERAKSSDAGVRVVAEHAPGAAAAVAAPASRAGADEPPSTKTGTAPTLEDPLLERDRSDRRAPAPDAPAAGSPVPPAGLAPPVSGGAKAPAAVMPVEGPAVEQVTDPVRSTVDAVEGLAGLSDSTEPQPAASPPPVGVDLREIGDHLGVGSASPPIDVGGLLRQVTAVPEQ